MENNLFITEEEIIEILEKRIIKKDNNKNSDNISKEDITNFISTAEKDKFVDLFNKIFEEEVFPTSQEDQEDGPINEICLKIISDLRDTFNKIDKEKLVKFLLKLLTKIIFKKEEE